MRRSDSLLNGLLIGMASGASVGYATGDAESLWSRSNGLLIGAAELVQVWGWPSMPRGTGRACWSTARESARRGRLLARSVRLSRARVQGVAIRWTF